MEPAKAMEYLEPEVRPLYASAPDLWLALRAAVNHEIAKRAPEHAAVPWLRTALEALAKAEGL